MSYYEIAISNLPIIFIVCTLMAVILGITLAGNEIEKWTRPTKLELATARRGRTQPNMYSERVRLKAEVTNLQVNLACLQKAAGRLQYLSANAVVKDCETKLVIASAKLDFLEQRDRDGHYSANGWFVS